MDHPDLKMAVMRKILGSDNVSTALGNQRKEASKVTRQKYLDFALVMGYDKRRFQALIHDLNNYFSKDTNSWPNTNLGEYALLTNCTVYRRSTGCVLQDVGISFHQRYEKSDKGGSKQAGGGDKWPNRCHKYFTCHRCGQKGHIAPDCHIKTESNAHIHTQDGNESPQYYTDATEVSSITEHMENGISDLVTKEANKLLIKSIQETVETNDGAAYHMADFLGFNSFQNAVAYASKAFNLSNGSIPNMCLLLD